MLNGTCHAAPSNSRPSRPVIRNKQRLTVCIVCYSVQRTEGQGRVNFEIIKHLSGQGHMVHVLSRHIDKGIAGLPGISHVRIGSVARVPTTLARDQVFALRTSYWLHRHAHEMDIVHLNGAITYAVADVNTSHFVHSQWAKSPFHTARVEGSLYAAYQLAVTRLNSAWERTAYRQARCVVAVSEFCRAGLIGNAEVPPDSITVIPNGVDPNEFRPAIGDEKEAIRSELSIPRNAIVLLFAGAAKTNRKNLDLPLRAMASLDGNCHLLVVGEFRGGAYPTMARRLGLADRVHFTGYRSDLHRLMRCADVFVFPSHYDTFALTVLEAMASGLPVIVTPSVGCVNLIVEGINGFVLANGDDVQGLIKVIQMLVDDPLTRRSVGSAARMTAEQNTWSSMAKKYETLYRRLSRSVANSAHEDKS